MPCLYGEGNGDGNTAPVLTPSEVCVCVFVPLSLSGEGVYWALFVNGKSNDFNALALTCSFFIRKTLIPC